MELISLKSLIHVLHCKVETYRDFGFVSLSIFSAMGLLLLLFLTVAIPFTSVVGYIWKGNSS